MITAEIDGTEYSGIENISVGGKTIALTESDKSVVTQPLTITANGTYYPDSGVDGFSSVVANIAGLAANFIRESKVVEITPNADTNEDIVFDISDMSGCDMILTVAPTPLSTTRSVLYEISTRNKLGETEWRTCYGYGTGSAYSGSQATGLVTEGENSLTVSHANYGGTKCYLRAGYTYQYVLIKLYE